MRVDIRDVKAVGALRPLEVAAYLRAKGWAQKHATPGREAIWASVAGGEEYEILLPLDQTIPDFSLFLTAHGRSAPHPGRGRTPISDLGVRRSADHYGGRLAQARHARETTHQ